jgi:hypothetical protein
MIKLRKDTIHDPIWRASQQSPDVAFTVHNMDDEIFRAWSRSSTNQPQLIHGDRLLRLRELIKKRPFATKAQIASWGITVRKEDEHYRVLEAIYARMRKRTAQRVKEDEDNAALWKLISGVEENKMNYGKSKERVEELKGQLKRLKDELEEDKEEVFEHEPERRGCLVPVRIGNTCSSKLNFILDEV